MTEKAEAHKPGRIESFAQRIGRALERGGQRVDSFFNRVRDFDARLAQGERRIGARAHQLYNGILTRVTYNGLTETAARFRSSFEEFRTRNALIQADTTRAQAEDLSRPEVHTPEQKIIELNAKVEKLDQHVVHCHVQAERFHDRANEIRSVRSLIASVDRDRRVQAQERWAETTANVGAWFNRLGAGIARGWQRTGIPARFDRARQTLNRTIESGRNRGADFLQAASEKLRNDNFSIIAARNAMAAHA